MKNGLNNEKRTKMDRCGFLKRAALATAAICMKPAFEKVKAAENEIGGQSVVPAVNDERMSAIHDFRTLGKGDSAMHVATIGFGCMGLNYHRSRHPDEKAAIRLVHEAIERGVTLFDTAESYGPYTNERLMNKAPFIVPIPGTTKLSHLEENLRAAEVYFTTEEMKELEATITAIPIVGDRYNAEQESKILK